VVEYSYAQRIHMVRRLESAVLSYLRGHCHIDHVKLRAELMVREHGFKPEHIREIVEEVLAAQLQSTDSERLKERAEKLLELVGELESG
jgi:hypothetical protein